jgi:predicted TIM-barrel fold metal-dependent hydrolase
LQVLPFILNIQSHASTTGFPNAIVARVDLQDEKVEDDLKYHLQFANFRGIRQMLNFHPSSPNLCFTNRLDWMKDPNWRKGFGLLSKYNLSFDLQCYYFQLDDAVELAKDYTTTQIILNHVGFPMGYLDQSKDAFEGWKNGISKVNSHLILTFN